MQYAARHTVTALSCVEEILAHSYSACGLVALDSPNAFEAGCLDRVRFEDIAWVAGIEQQRLEAAAAATGDRNKDREYTS